MKVFCTIKSTSTYLLLFLLFLFTTPEKSTAFGLPPVTYIGIEQGLSNNAVTCIYQDHNGFMWFGTYDGLNKYDGYNFTTFRNKIGDSTSLIDNNIYIIEGDANHNIWLGNRTGICVLNPITQAFSTRYYNDLNSRKLEKITGNIHTIKAVGNNIWVGTENHSLILFDNNSVYGHQIHLLNNGVKKIGYEVTAIQWDAATNQGWFFVENEGLGKYDAKQNAIIIINRSIKKCHCLQIDKLGNIWLGNDDGLYAYNIAGNSYSTNYLVDKCKVSNICRDRQGVLWVASDGGGMFTISNSANNRPIVASSVYTINSNSVHSIYEDVDGRKWIGTLRGGINIIEASPNPFQTVSVVSKNEPSSAKNFIMCFGETADHNIWLGTDGGGLKYWNRSLNSFVGYSHQSAVKNSLSSNLITDILTDFQNRTWVSTWAGGINRYDKTTNAFEHFYCFNPITKQQENNVWLLYEDLQKTLWASSVNNGTLYYFDRAANKFQLFDANIKNIQCLAEDKEGNLWGGNYNSLIKIDKVGKKHINFQIDVTIRSIHEDAKGNFWVGTDGGGLLNFNRKTNKFVRYTITEGLPNNSILRILEDKNGNLWLSTFNGLSKFNVPKNLFTNFSQSDGLQSNQFSFNAALKAGSGEFMFGGVKGFTIFYPDSLKVKTGIPPIFLTGLRVNNSAVKSNDSYISKRTGENINELTIPYAHAALSFDFAALEYASPDKIAYAYYLEGWDKSWNYPDKSRTANYTRLEEGHYTLKIKNTNAEGKWGNVKTVFEVVVLPPWYRSWWAYLLYVLVVGGIFYLYIKYKSRQAKLEYEIKLAHLENEKEKQLAENEKQLTERKIAFFTHISHEFRTPLTLIIGPLKDMLGIENHNKELIGIYRNAKRMLSLVDQLLLFRKAESVDQHLHITSFDLAAVCKEVYLSFKQYAVTKSIHFNFTLPQNVITIYADKEKIEIILFNLLSNAFKFTEQAGSIQFGILENENIVDVFVTDNGCGISPEIGDRLFESFYQPKNSHAKKGFGIGLYLSKKLADSHGGNLSYSSESGHGTRFCLTLQKGKAHFPLAFLFEAEPTTVPSAKLPPPETGGSILEELMEELDTETVEQQPLTNKNTLINKLVSELPTMLIVDDDEEIRDYIKRIFIDSFTICEAADGTDGYLLARKESPDIIISDVFMKEMNGTEMCIKIKETPTLAHIPIILLTGSSSPDVKMQGIEGGAEAHITKPFDKELLMARVDSIMKGRNRLQQYFYNAITLKPNFNIAGEHKEFIEQCIAITEEHLDDPDFNIKSFSMEIGMSHSKLYKKVKAVSGLSINVFIRYLRLKKAAELFINTDSPVTDVANTVGIYDIKYFREQFNKLFEMNPSEYIKRYRKVLGKKVKMK